MAQEHQIGMTERYYQVQESMKGTDSWYDITLDGKREHLASAVERANTLGHKNHMFKYRVVRRIDEVVTEQGMMT